MSEREVLMKAIRQLVFDVVMGELGMDEFDMDDQAYASEATDKWMEHWERIKPDPPAEET